jgi:hypothetical protein
VIRNFIYLDSEKLRSFSSQLFEGVTEQVVSHNSEANTETEQQKGPVASGRILGDIFATERSSSELKFLEDHAYSIFESKLDELKNLTVINQSTNVTKIKNTFVKVVSRLQLNDLAASVGVLRQFNEMGEAVWRVTNESMTIQGPSGITKIAPDAEAKKKAGEMGLQLHKKVAESAAFLIDINFQDLFEVSMNVEDVLISAPMKRQFLREEESLLVHKYSRMTSFEFTLLGLVTQNGAERESEEDIPEVKDAENLKTAMRYLAQHMRTMENAFGAPLSNEIIVDPIAVYSEIR